jgi:hypothetical protein
MLRISLIFIFLLLPHLTFSLPEQEVNPLDSGTGFQPNIKPSLEISRLKGVIQIDGELDDPGWEDAVMASNFTEISPGNQTKPPVKTVAWITYDDTYLYLGFLAYDDPSSVRASFQDRDDIFGDDFIGIFLDTYGDATWAYEIYSNPLGIQGDLRWSDSSGEDMSFDIIFESGGKITDLGYQVELAVPFSSLRFPNKPIQSWRATFLRIHPRDSRRQYSWATKDPNDACLLCQFGTLSGIEILNQGRDLELLATLVGFQSGALEDDSDPHSNFDNDNIDGDASFGIKYSLSSSITADAAINPDFSQVESDVGQIDVNTTFALFFPERRPFFQEGSDLFDTWINAVYTRSINDPLVAAKLTGRLGKSSIAYIGARDEESPIILPFEDESEIISAGKSTSNILRYKQTFSGGNYLGGLLTDRRLDGDGSGSLLTSDGMIRFLKSYSLEMQAAASHTKEPDDTALTSDIEVIDFDRGNYTAAFDGESFWGHAFYASFERDARHWNFDIDYTETSPTFRADNGFVTRNDSRRIIPWTGVLFYPDSKIIEHIFPNINAGWIWNFDDVRKDEWVNTELNVQFKGQTSTSVSYLASRERFQDIVFPGIRRWESYVESNFSDFVSVGTWASQGRFIARNEDPPVLGRGTVLDLWGSIKPIKRLVIQPNYSYSELRHPDTDSTFFSGFILRTRANYQFTRELSLRFVVQYDDFDKAFDIEPLLTYKLNPFTIFYIGSTLAYMDYEETREPVQTSRQFFLKLQYLFQV